MRVSEYFKLGKSQPYLDFVDIRIDTDIPVFLDPTAIKSLESNWGNELTSLLQTYFETVLDLIRNDENLKAQRLLASLSERNEFHLGFSKGKSRGHAFGEQTAKSVWGALSKSNASLTGLLEDLEDTCLLIEGIGKDMISDAVSNILRGPLIEYTQRMCRYYGIPLTPGIESGPIWNAVKGKWEQVFTELPVADGEKLILVPKILVRNSFTYKYDEYYRHYLLPEMQQEELQARSTLVEVLKDGSERVTKKALMEKYGADKLAVVRETLKKPHVLEDYREIKKDQSSLPLSHDEIAEIEDSEKPDWTGLIRELKGLGTGQKHAKAYEDLIEKIFSALLYPSLCYPSKQHHIHNGRKIIDLRYTNVAKNGFFYFLMCHYCCPQLFVECKNYGNDINNPEVDQISGRFGPTRGKVGILTFRQIDDKQRLIARCRDTALDGRGFVIPLDDSDIIKLITEKDIEPLSNEHQLLRERFDLLIS